MTCLESNVLLSPSAWKLGAGACKSWGQGTDGDYLGARSNRMSEINFISLHCIALHIEIHNLQLNVIIITHKECNICCSVIGEFLGITS